MEEIFNQEIENMENSLYKEENLYTKAEVDNFVEKAKKNSHKCEFLIFL